MTAPVWRITQGDADILGPALTPASVDAIITDPPYGTNDGRGKRSAKGGDSAADFAHAWDTVLPLAWFSWAVNVVRPGGAVMVFSDAKRVGEVWEAGEAAGLKGRQLFYWQKSNCPPTPRKNFASAVEAGVFLVRPGGSNVWNGGGWCRNIIEHKLAHNEQDGQTRHHPTQKPIGVMRWLVELVTNPGDLVLDPFAGSGTTGVACVQTGRRFLGFELDQAFADRAVARLNAWTTTGADFRPRAARLVNPRQTQARRPRAGQLELLSIC